MASSSSNKSPSYKFFEAAFTGNLKGFKKLASQLNAGEGLSKTCLRVKDAKGQTAFHFAAAGGHTHIFKYLVEQLKVDINVKDGKGDIPLHQAALGEHVQTTQYLIEHGADIKICNGRGYTALHCAAESGHPDIVRFLVSLGAEVEAKSDAGTPLQCAASKGKKEAIKVLLDSKANPNAGTLNFFTPLLLAIIAQSAECVDLLIEGGADPNLGSSVVTPLLYAANEGETKFVKCLLKAGANPNITDGYDMTPLEVAALNGNHEMVRILFPATSQISTISDWSISGIMNYIHSGEAGKQRDIKKKEYFQQSKLKGEASFKKQEYLDAIYWYTNAINTDPSDPTVLSSRSLCWSRLKEGERALSDAEACIALKPDWAKAHYREGVAWKLLKNYPMATEAFSEALRLDPDNQELQKVFRESASAEFGIPLKRDIAIVRV